MPKLATSVVVLLLFAVAGGLFMYIFSEARSPSYTARAVLAVPPAPERGLSDDPERSSQLASTYTALLKGNRRLQRIIARESGIPRSRVAAQLIIDKTPNAPIVEITVQGGSPDASRRGASAAIEAVSTGAPGVLDQAVPDTISIARRPATGVRTPQGLFSSRGTLLVQARTTTQPDPTGANKLAGNYAELIPEDDALIGAAARRVGVTPRWFRSRLRAVNAQNTSLVRVSFTAGSYDLARRAINALTTELARPARARSLVPPESITLVHRPEDRRATSRSKIPVIAGIILGLAAGVAFLALRRRRDPQIRDSRLLEEVLGAPAVEVPEGGGPFAQSLATVLDGRRHAGRLELVQARPLSDDARRAVLDGARSPVMAGHLADPDLRTAAGAGAGAVLVVPAGTSVNQVRDAEAGVRRAGGAVVAGVLVR